jgi:DNA-binding CsgD family transcriptional regulator
MTFKGPPRPRQALKALGVGVDRRVGAGDDRARTRAGPRDPRADPGAELTRRRERRRVDAREHLRTAHHMFMTMGIEAFAARTAREPLATGEKAREWVPETGGQLTAQERQIARLARDGLSNQEIGSQLFLSPRTVEYHLTKIFAKLDVRSRKQLARVLASDRNTAQAF